jgi:hypothetical protein
VTHPAQHHVDATRKHQKAWVEGRKRGGAVDRPGRAYGGAAEDKNTQSTADEYPGEANKHDRGPCPYRAAGGGIHIKPSHRGELHQELGVPAGDKIPERKLERAKDNAGPAERKRITFAENARKWGK